METNPNNLDDLGHRLLLRREGSPSERGLGIGGGGIGGLRFGEHRGHSTCVTLRVGTMN